MKVKEEKIETIAQSHPPTSDSEAQMGSQELVVGTIAWFATVVGLQNWGIDPLRDIHHVTDLEEIFGHKVN